MTKENNLEQGGFKMSKEQAIAHIEMIKGQVTQMGNNDSEIPELIRLAAEIENGGDIEKAVTRSNQIVSAKMMNDYH